MLFVIDEGIVNHLITNENQPTAITTAVECIAHARRAGYHLLFAEREVLDFLRKYESFSVAARSVFNKLYSRVALDKAYFDLLSWRIRVVAETGRLDLNLIGAQTEIVISAESLESPLLTSPTIFLSENQTDIALYDLIARTYMSWAACGHVNLHYERRGGGGSTCAAEYRDIQSQQQRLCLCIVDSDCKFENSPIGATPRSVQSVDITNQLLCKLYILPSREIENFIPTPILDLAIGNDHSRNGVISFLRVLESLPVAKARLFLDFKHGLRLYDLTSQRSYHQYYQYWSDVIAMLGLTLKCQSSSTCLQRSQCTCVLIPGMGNNVLQAVISATDNKPTSDIAALVDNQLRHLWSELGDIIISWCGSGPRIST